MKTDPADPPTEQPPYIHAHVRIELFLPVPKRAANIKIASSAKHETHARLQCV